MTLLELRLHPMPARPLESASKGAFLQLQSRPNEDPGSQGPAGPGRGHLRAQSRLPPSKSQGHIDYFELKLLKKQPMQERHSEPPFHLLESRK